MSNQRGREKRTHVSTRSNGHSEFVSGPIPCESAESCDSHTDCNIIQRDDDRFHHVRSVVDDFYRDGEGLPECDEREELLSSLDCTVTEIGAAMKILSMCQGRSFASPPLLSGENVDHNSTSKPSNSSPVVHQLHPGSGLSGIALSTLEHAVQPIVEALRHVDAAKLLDVQSVSLNTPGTARMDDSFAVHPIHQLVCPPCQDASSVRYLEISEVEGMYSMGIFLFPPNARIPLHDHPEMCVVSRVLYGDIYRMSLDFVRDHDSSGNAGQRTWTSLPNDGTPRRDSNISHPSAATTNKRRRTGSARLRQNSDDGVIAQMFSARPSVSDDSDSSDDSGSNRRRVTNSLFEGGNGFGDDRGDRIDDEFPTGSITPSIRARAKPALLHKYRDHLHAPAVTALFPFEGNLHEFVAGPNGAAVLDVLLPPYSTADRRDCTFYEIQHVRPPEASDTGTTGPRSGTSNISNREPCWVVPTDQPESFHCISGSYKNLGLRI